MKIKPEILRVYGVTDASWTGRFTLLEQVEQAIQAEQAGADYLGVGAVFGTSTKMDAEKISLERLKEICQAVTIPVVAIGGVQKDNFPELVGQEWQEQLWCLLFFLHRILKKNVGN